MLLFLELITHNELVRNLLLVVNVALGAFIYFYLEKRKPTSQHSPEEYQSWQYLYVGAAIVANIVGVAIIWIIFKVATIFKKPHR